jgi:general secretion pathway protein H
MSRAQGFTLVEMLIVLGIMALILAIAIPQIDLGLVSTQAQGAADEIAATLRATRAEAIAQGQPVDFVIDLERGAFGGGGRAYQVAATEGLQIALYTSDGAVANATRGSIRFYPDGGSTGGGITLKVGARLFVVAVDWLGGAVSVRRRVESEGR